MKIASGVGEMVFGPVDPRARTVPAVGNWLQRLANALSLSGYMTVDLRGIERSSFVPLDAAIARAQQDYAGARSGSWDRCFEHLVGLKVLNVRTVAILADAGNLNLVALRVAADGSLDTAEVEGYMANATTWASTLSKLLPEAQLTDDEKQAADRVGGWIGKYRGSDAVGATAAKLLRFLIEAGKGGQLATFHPVVQASDAFRRTWEATDLTSEPFSGLWIQNVLWSLNDWKVVPAGHSWAEQGLWKPEFADTLRNVTDT